MTTQKAAKIPLWSKFKTPDNKTWEVIGFEGDAVLLARRNLAGMIIEMSQCNLSVDTNEKEME